MAIDPEITAGLAEIAETLEDLAGIEPDPALKRDVDIVARLTRIKDSIQGGALEAHSLTSHPDVSAPSPNDGDFFRYNSSINAWAAAAMQLSDATDVSATPTAGTYLRGDGSVWSESSILLADLPAISFNDLSDVIITGPIGTGEVVKWTGVQWINAELLPIELGNTFFVPGTADSLVLTDASSLTNTIGYGESDLLLRDGSRALTANWDAGNFTIEANKFVAQGTTMAAYDAADFGIDVTTTGNDFGTIYRGLYLDLDYVLDTGHLGAQFIYGAEANVNAGGAGTYIARNMYGYAVKLAMDGETPSNYPSNPVGFVASVRTAFAGNTFGAYTQGVQNHASGVGYGYQGYGQNAAAGASGLRAVGLYGFAQATTGIELGVRANPFSTGVNSFAFYSNQGHNHYNNGVTYFYASTAIQSAVNKTHVTTADSGSVWIEEKLEVDGTCYLDGDLDHSGTNIGFFGTAPAAQAPAYTPTNVTTDRSYDANSTTLDEIADVLGTLIADLQSYGLLQ